MTVQRREQMLRCPQCNGQEMDDDRRSGDLVCVGCGLVCRERAMVASYDARAFDDTAYSAVLEVETVVGAVSASRGTVSAAASTKAGRLVAAASQGTVSAAASTEAGRLGAAHRRVTGVGGGEARKHALRQEVARLCEALELPSCIGQAAETMCLRADSCAEAGGKKGRGGRRPAAAALAAGAVMIACEDRGVGRTLKEMAKAAGGRVSKNQIARAKKGAQRTLQRCPRPVSAAALVPRFCSHLAAGPAVEARALWYAEQGAARLPAMQIVRVPTSVAAGAILAASREVSGRGGGAGGLTAREVSQATGAAESTVLLVASELERALRGGVA